MLGLFKRKKPLSPERLSPERQSFDDIVTLLVCGLDERIRTQAIAQIDLDGVFNDCRRNGDSPLEAGFHATRLILSALIDSMTNAEREKHKRAFEAEDWSDPFCKMLNYMGQVATQAEDQGRVKPILVR